MPKNCLSDDGKVRINEIFPNPSGEDDKEFIEIYNESKNDVDLSGWKIKDDTKNGKYIFFNETEIKSKEYKVVFKDKYKFALNNTGDEKVYLFNNEGEEVDKMSYKNSVEGYSYNYSDEGWYWDVLPTPGEKNSEKPKPKEYSSQVRFNEIFPNPAGDEKTNEYLEFYNFGKEEINLKNWKIKDSSKSGEYIFPKDFVVESGLYRKIYRSDFKFALNNSNEVIYLFDPNGKEIDEAKYSESAKENVSYNFDGQKWRWSRFLTPGNENQFNNLPNSKLKVEKKVYKNMLAEFRVSAKDKDKDKLKFVWDFGDEHKSYKQNTKHKYLKKGVYQVSLKISDGSEDIFEAFEIEVGNFPKKELKIIGVKANPKGKDTKLEAIKIKNNSKKKINLKGWSIATGWKNLYNHPITKKFVLKPGETKELTRKYSLFALNNKQTRIELRYPDGKIASKVKYSKKEGIQDDETYEKTENGWEWVEIRTDTNKTRTSMENTLEAQERRVLEQNMENNNQDNTEENKPEEKIQEDESEQAEGEILGAETVKDYENISDDKPVSGNFFQKIFWNVNRFISNLINLFF